MTQPATVDRREPAFWRAAPFIFVFFWSGGYAFAKLGLAHVEPMTMLAIRYGLAMLAFVPFVLLRRVRWPSTVAHWGAIALTGFLIQCVYFGLSYLALKRGMNAGTTAIIVSLQPVLVAVLSALLGGRRGAAKLWLGLILGFGGVMLVIWAQGGGGPSPWGAIVPAFGALLGMTAATLFEKWHGFRTDPAVGGLVQYVVGFAVLLPVAWISESMVVDWAPALFVSLAYLVIGNSIISVGLYILMLQRGDATRISSLLYLVPPLALFAAWALLGEPVPPLAFVGLALSVAGVYLVSSETRQRPA